MTRLLAEFDAPEALVLAVRSLRGRTDLRAVDAFRPYPVHEIEHALEIGRSRIPLLSFAAGMLAAGAAYLLQWWMNAHDYPLDVGGRPPHMPPAFVPVTFEMGILAAACTAFLAVLVRAGLPRLWHPVFDADGFQSASVDRFWLALRAEADELPALEAARDELLAAGALRVVRED